MYPRHREAARATKSLIFQTPNLYHQLKTAVSFTDATVLANADCDATTLLVGIYYPARAISDLETLRAAIQLSTRLLCQTKIAIMSRTIE